MVNLDLEVKRSIVRKSANNMTQKENAEYHGTSATTLRRVLAEHREGKFKLGSESTTNLTKQKKDDVDKSKVKPKPKRKGRKKLTKQEEQEFAQNLQKLIGKTDSPLEPEDKTLDEKIDEAIEEFAYVITPMNVSFTYLGEAYSADMTCKKYSEIVAALLAADGKKAVELLDVSTAINEFMKGHVEVKGGVVTYRGMTIDGGMTDRIIEAMKCGDSAKVDILVSFFANLINNPSKRAINELYGFLVAADIEITEDGHFLAYKRIRNNWKDIHSNTMLNKPGMTVWMQRHDVDDDKEQTCSSGLHVCSKGYLPHFGNAHNSRTVLCKVNPRDVVSVPTDYNNTKLRCNEYVVLHEIDADFNEIKFVE